MPIPQSGFIIIMGRAMLVNTACMQMRGPTPRRQTRSHSIKFHPGVRVRACVCVVGGAVILSGHVLVEDSG